MEPFKILNRFSYGLKKVRKMEKLLVKVFNILQYKKIELKSQLIQTRIL
jgi:hypothetical protein